MESHGANMCSRSSIIGVDFCVERKNPEACLELLKQINVNKNETLNKHLVYFTFGIVQYGGQENQSAQQDENRSEELQK